MLKLADLDGIKLVNNDYFATDVEAELAVEQAITQGSQAWGVRRSDGVILKLARDLKIALALAATADENGRMLKGAQLANGRLKKQCEKLNTQEVATRQFVTEISERLADSQKAVFDALAAKGELQRDLDLAKEALELLAATPVDG